MHLALNWIAEVMQAQSPDAPADHGSGKKAPLGENKEVPWDLDGETFISAKEAVEEAKKSDPNFNYGQLYTRLKPDGPMRYMRNPNKGDKGPGSVQCKVHKEDFKTWCDGLTKGGAKKKHPRKRTSNCADSDGGLYEAGYTKGRQDGYARGYSDVKESKQHSSPPFQVTSIRAPGTESPDSSSTWTCTSPACEGMQNSS